MAANENAPTTGFIVVYRCGCAEVRPGREGFHDRCPHHGLDQIKAPEYVVDHRADKSSTFHGWYPEDDTTVVPTAGVA